MHYIQVSPLCEQKDQNSGRASALPLLTQGQSLPTTCLYKTLIKTTTTQNASPYTMKMYTALYVKTKLLTFEYKLPTLQTGWEILYVTFLWITLHRLTWKSLQNAKSCPQCLDVLYLYVPMYSWRTGGWFYPLHEWCEKSWGFANSVWPSST